MGAPLGLCSRQAVACRCCPRGGDDVRLTYRNGLSGLHACSWGFRLRSRGPTVWRAFGARLTTEDNKTHVIVTWEIRHQRGATRFRHAVQGPRFGARHSPDDNSSNCKTRTLSQCRTIRQRYVKTISLNLFRKLQFMIAHLNIHKHISFSILALSIFVSLL